MVVVQKDHGRRQAASDRYGFIDNAKAIGMVLIVLGHSRGLPDYLMHLIFGFHVPLFFFISGFLLKPAKLEESVGSNAKKILRQLGLPYLLFFVLAWLYWLATRDIGGKALLTTDRAWYAPLAGLFSGLQFDLYVDPPLWFFSCLIMTAIAYQASRKFLNLNWSTCLFTVFAVVLAVLWTTTSPSARLPLGLDNMWIALAFYALGQYLRVKNVFAAMRPSVLMAVFLVASALLVYMVELEGRIDMASMLFGTLPVLYLPTALCGIIATLSISQCLPRSGLANWLSENTLTIFPAHFLFLSLVRGIAITFHLIPGDYDYALGWSIISSTLAIALCVPLVWCLRRSPVAIVPKAR